MNPKAYGGWQHDEIHTDMSEMRAASGIVGLGNGSISNFWGQAGESNPIGIHQSPTQRAEQRLSARGFAVVRQVSNRR